ncbi:MAG: trypsin-like peptidase domain-containing protein, partial [Lachnospiraceae bacterium]|nr:trypsin-like peptidase domain-containing protein [Lachnospiraceae bacterium]
IAKGYKIYIYFDDPRTRPYEVESIIGYDSEFDLALIKINRTDLVPIEFFDSDDLTIGESVIAIGSPGGIEFMNSVCDGIVSGLKRTVTSSESGATLYDMIQITAPINPGNSGGAVVNSKGQLVGISVIKIVAENYENMAFAISSDTASRLIQSFRKYGKYVKPLLGVTINTLYGWKEADEYGWPLGCQVVAVSEGSGAEKAGIREGDIICLINGKDTPDYTSLRTYLLKFAPGDEVTFNVFRPADNKYYELKITLTAA